MNMIKENTAVSMTYDGNYIHHFCIGKILRIGSDYDVYCFAVLHMSSVKLQDVLCYLFHIQLSISGAGEHFVHILSWTRWDLNP